MIWRTLSDQQEGQEALQKHVVAEILSACPEIQLHEESLTELAQVVAEFCTEQGYEQQIPSDFLALALTRALRGIGEGQAAQRLEEARASSRQDVALLDATWPGAIDAETWNIFASRLMRPSRWFTGDGQIMWVLDFSRLSQDVDLSIELALLPSLRILLERMADVWDSSGGAGTLGLREAPAFFSWSGKRKSARRGGIDLAAYCEAVLGKIQEHRGWKAAPRVVRMDFSLRR